MCGDGKEAEEFFELFLPSSMAASFLSLNATSTAFAVVGGDEVWFSMHGLVALMSSSFSSMDLSIEPCDCGNE